MEHYTGYKDSHFDLLTAEEVEEWAWIRAARDKVSDSGDDHLSQSTYSSHHHHIQHQRKVLWKEIYAEAYFLQRMQNKYKVEFSFHDVDSFIKARRRSDKLSGIIDNPK
jgi:hypothetical protein